MKNKRSGFALTETLVILAIAIVGLISYAVYAENVAEKQAQEFCAPLKAGAPTEGLIQAALAKGADERMTHWIKIAGEPDWLPVTFKGILIFSRHMCSIHAANGKVIDAAYSYLD